MMPTNSRGPVVLVAHGSALASLQLQHRTLEVRLDPSDTIDAGSLAANQVLIKLLKKTKDAGGRLHLICLVSDVGRQGCLLAVLDVAQRAGVRVVVHAILDGSNTSARQIMELESALEGGVGRIGTVSGQAWAMDCEGRFERIEKAYRALLADGAERSDSALRGIQAACAFGQPEAFVKPFIVFDYPGVSLVDSALHLHLAGDQARALSQALGGPSFEHFARKAGRAPFAGRYACMTPYDNALALPSLFPRAPDPESLLFDVIASASIEPFQCSQGSAQAIAQASSEAIRSGARPLVLADFASPSNTAFTGSAAAVEQAIAQIVEVTRAQAGAALIVGGRSVGNTFPVTYVHDADPAAELREDAQCSDLAATLLELLQRPQPAELEGRSLLRR